MVRLTLGVLRLWAVIGLTALSGCGHDFRTQQNQATRLLDAGRLDSARVVITALAEKLPADTAVLGLEVRLYSAERRFREATDSYRRRLESSGGQSCELLATILRASLRDAESQVVRFALDASGLLGIVGVHDGLLQACRDMSPGVRQAAVDALGRMPIREVGFWTLVSCLQDASEHVRAAVLDAWLRNGDLRGYAFACSMQRDFSDYVLFRAAVLRVLALVDLPGWKLSSEETKLVGYIRRSAASRLGPLAMQAAECLVRLGEERHLALLGRGLSQGDDATRSYAVASLGDLRAREYLPDIVAATRDSAESVRWQAARALGEIGDTLTRPELVPLLADVSDAVRAEAAVALARLGAPGDLLVPLLADSSMPVRAAAVAALCARSTPLGPIQFADPWPDWLDLDDASGIVTCDDTAP